MANLAQFTLKFTRGDIVVDLQKLKFFQSQLTRSLISGTNPDHNTLKTRIIQPIMNELQKLDEKLKDYLENGKIDPDPGSQNVIESIAPRSEEPALTEDYVLQILQVSKGTVDNPTTFLHNNILAFYRPSKGSMRKAFLELQAPLRKLMMVESVTRLLNTDISSVLRAIVYKLKEIDPEDWTEKLGDVVYPLADSVKYYNTHKRQDNLDTAGWKFMRHGVLNGQPGLGILPIMKLLGKEETIRRIRDARKIASEQEEKARKAAERELEEKEAAKVSTRRLTPGPRVEEAKQAASTRNQNQVGSVKTYEPRNQRVSYLNESKEVLALPGTGPFSIPSSRAETRREQMLKEGPFKARAPTPSPKSLARDPSEVDRAPQFLTPTEFEQGRRHIKGQDTREAALYKIEELQYQERARRREQEAIETARRYAEERSKGGGWVAPRRPATPRDAPNDESPKAPPEKPGAFLANDPILTLRNIPVDQITAANKAYKTVQALSAASAARRRKQILAQMDPPVVLTNLDRDKGTLAQRAEFIRQEQLRRSMPGPFRPPGATSQVVDVDRHIKHLRALNRTRAFRRAEQKHQQRATRPLPNTAFRKLLATGASTPLSLRSADQQAAEGSGAPEKSRVSREARDTTVAKLNRDLAARGAGRSSRDAKSVPATAQASDLILDYYMTRKVASASSIAMKMKQDHEASQKRAERMMADLSSRAKY